MKSAEQFMQEYIAERDRKCHDLYGELLGSLPETSEEHLESANNSENVAVVTTRIDCGKYYLRHRYRLCPAGESWVIEKAIYQRGRCRGSGKKPDNGEDCVKCKGEGWVQFTINNGLQSFSGRADCACVAYRASLAARH
jgi:DnaJ-class molecular chaperone